MCCRAPDCTSHTTHPHSFLSGKKTDKAAAALHPSCCSSRLDISHLNTNIFTISTNYSWPWRHWSSKSLPCVRILKNDAKMNTVPAVSIKQLIATIKSLNSLQLISDCSLSLCCNAVMICWLQASPHGICSTSHTGDTADVPRTTTASVGNNAM